MPPQTPNSLLESFFNEYLKLYPSLCSFLGDRRCDSEFENTLNKSHNIKFGRLMRKYERLIKYNKDRSIDTQVLRYILKDNRESMRFTWNLTPITSFENCIIDFSFYNRDYYPLTSQLDFENLFTRYNSFVDYIDSCIRKFKVGIKQKHVLPKCICNKMIHSLDNFIKNKGYYIEIPKKLRNCDTFSKYETFMNTIYIKKLNQLLRFLKHVYLPNCRTSIGLCALPKGKNIYKYLVKSYTTIDVSPEYVHKLGYQEVKRISQEMEAIKKVLGFHSTTPLQNVNKNMTNDGNNYFSNANSLLKEFKKIQQDINKDVIPKNFHNDVQDHKLKEVPKSLQETSAGAFYLPGSVLNDLRKGTFFINTRNMRENAKFNMMTLSLHEGKPGHHYQFQYMTEKKVPAYRQYCVNGTSFVEGWALYAESLGNYQDTAYNYFGKLTYEMFRAVRLVVDTGIHYYNWTYDEAVEYMLKHVALSRSEIETEVQRYICIPGQALCYKIGERKIMSWRTKYLEEFGNNEKSIKDFHKIVLEDGILPLSIIENKIYKIISKHNKLQKNIKPKKT